MKLYIVRHGATNSNAEGKSMGKRIDESLNEKGVEQAAKLAEKLPKDFDVLISSPMKRTYQTAEQISQRLHLPIIAREELMERDFGSLSAKKWPEIEELTGGKVKYDTLNQLLEYDFGKFEGETIEQVRYRLTKFVEWVKKEYSDKKVLVVGHGGVTRVMYALFTGRYPENMENISMHEIEV